MADTLPLADKIQQNSQHSRKHNVLTTQYGDGFTQVAEWGANAKMDKWTLNYSGLTQAERDFLFNSFDLTTRWNWTAFGDSVEKQWRYTGTYSESNQGNIYSVKLRIEQVFGF